MRRRRRADGFGCVFFHGPFSASLLISALAPFGLAVACVTGVVHIADELIVIASLVR